MMDLKRFIMMIHIEQVNLYVYIRYLNPVYNFVYLQAKPDLSGITISVSKKKRKAKDMIILSNSQFEKALNDHLDRRKRYFIQKYEENLRDKFEKCDKPIIIERYE